MVFLALRSMPNRTATRHELLAAAVELDRKFSAEKGLPRVFTGKTPMNSASACLTNNGDKYFISFKPEGSKTLHFRLAYQPGDFDTAVKEYDSWMEKLIKHDWPLCFGVPKEGAVPIHILEQQAQAQKALEQGTVAESESDHSAAETSTATAITIATDETADDASPSKRRMLVSVDIPTRSSPPVEVKKRSPEPLDSEMEADSRSNKKVKAELDSVSEDASTFSRSMTGFSVDHNQNHQDQDSKVTDKMEQLELQSSGTATPSLPSTPVGTLLQELGPITASPAALTSNVPTKAGDSSKVDEYRLEDLDLTHVPTCLADIVRVDVSTIPNSGKGLFATRDLPASTPLGFYFGVPMTENEFDSLKDGVGVAAHYSIMYRRSVLDATDENGMPYSDPNGRLYCPFHFMNENPNGNISFITGSVVNQVICTTNRDVKAGEELFVFYGNDVDRFWAQGQDGSGSECGAGDPKQGQASSRSRGASPIRREETSNRPRRSNVKPARYTR
ncbi:hypothetical protein BGZ51_005920 [Haplosporangium sp. Z 767]|nr:hypothetical protein BGZ51_005920 [Haplosporangium sp. Z 767]